jgi:hypothetical protein
VQSTTRIRSGWSGGRWTNRNEHPVPPAVDMTAIIPAQTVEIYDALALEPEWAALGRRTPQNVPEAPCTTGSTPLPGTLRFAQKPTEPSVAPGWMTRFQSNAGATETTPEDPEKIPFQLV